MFAPLPLFRALLHSFAETPRDRQCSGCSATIRSHHSKDMWRHRAWLQQEEVGANDDLSKLCFGPHVFEASSLLRGEDMALLCRHGLLMPALPAWCSVRALVSACISHKPSCCNAPARIWRDASNLNQGTYDKLVEVEGSASLALTELHTSVLECAHARNGDGTRYNNKLFEC